MFELFFFEIIFRNLKRTGKNKECVNSVLEFFSFIQGLRMNLFVN